MPDHTETQIQIIKKNLGILHARLRDSGYIFSNPDEALSRPDVQTESMLKLICEKAGAVPEALATFYRVVGSVDFTGYHPNWTGCEYPDAVVILPIAAAIEELKDYLLDVRNYTEAYGHLRLPIAPDYFHKANVSGGPCYAVAVPSYQDDPELLEEPHHTTFISYLRICFAWGGFPGLEHADSRHTWPLLDLRNGLRAL